MPSTMQHSMVSISAIIATPPDTLTIRVIRIEARPVEVMQPATRPAIEQATATVMVPLPPASSASSALAMVRLSVVSGLLVALFTNVLMMPTTMVIPMAMVAESCMVNWFVDTSTTRMIRGSSR